MIFVVILTDNAREMRFYYYFTACEADSSREKIFPGKVLKFHHFSLTTFSLTKIFPDEVFSDKVFNQNWKHDITYGLEPVSDMWS